MILYYLPNFYRSGSKFLLLNKIFIDNNWSTTTMPPTYYHTMQFSSQDELLKFKAMLDL